MTGATHSYQANETYTYDANGNRTMTGYSTGTNNRLLNDGTYSYQYDSEGNRTRRTKTSDNSYTEYDWDFRNRLTKVTNKNASDVVTQVVEYKYDVFDRRISRAVDTTSPFDLADAAIERYVLDDLNGVASLDGGNAVLDFVDPDGSGAASIAVAKRYLYGNQVDQLLAQEDVTKSLTAPDRVLWPLVDHLQTVRDLYRNDATSAQHYKYDSFGNVVSGDQSLTRYLFTSREFDSATKLSYNRARWYDGANGRWTSDDSLSFHAGDPNIARYISNAVLSETDPSGHERLTRTEREKLILTEVAADGSGANTITILRPGMIVILIGHGAIGTAPHVFNSRHPYQACAYVGCNSGATNNNIPRELQLPNSNRNNGVLTRGGAAGSIRRQDPNASEYWEAQAIRDARIRAMEMMNARNNPPRTVRVILVAPYGPAGSNASYDAIFEFTVDNVNTIRITHGQSE